MSVLGHLPRYSRAETELWNWYCRAFPSAPQWRDWAGEAWGSLLDTPAGVESRLTVSHCLEPQHPKRTYEITKDVTLIGRNAENDLVLSGQTITKQHARVLRRQQEIFIEDLSSTLGTFVGSQKLMPREPFRLRSGDQVTIFPYTLGLEEKCIWASERQVEISDPAARLSGWTEFAAGQPADALPFRVGVYPAGGSAALEVSREFLEEVVRRLIHPLVWGERAAGLVPADEGLIQFAILALLERANRELAFPFRFGLAPGAPQPAEGPGVALSFCVALSGIVGGCRIFLPLAMLEGMRRAWAVPAAGRDFPVSWKLTVTAAHVLLTTAEIRGIEPGDVVLLEGGPELQLPRPATGAWQLDERYAVKSYFERKTLMAVQEESKADLRQLPVRLDVVLGEKEFSLAELRELSPGTVLDLERSESEPVALFLNGKPAGQGELVEVEGRLGVKILSWSAGE